MKNSIIAARRHMTQQQMLEPRTGLLNCYYTVFAIPNPSCALHGHYSLWCEVSPVPRSSSSMSLSSLGVFPSIFSGMVVEPVSITASTAAAVTAEALRRLPKMMES